MIADMSQPTGNSSKVNAGTHPAHMNAGGRPDPAEDAIVARLNQALDLIEQDKFAEAEAICRREQQKHPRHPHVNRVLANALMLQRNFPQAMYFIDRCVQLAPPGDAMYLYIIGALRRQMNVDATCADLFDKAVAIDPTHVDSWLGLTDALLAIGRYRDGRDAASRGLEHHPGHPDLWHNHALALQSLGRAEESYRDADALVKAFPDYPPGILLRSGTAKHAGGVSPVQICDDVREYWKLRGARRGVGSPVSPETRARAVQAARDGVLRVGLLSPDFREHSVAYFIEPLLREFKGSRVETFCYSTSPHVDRVTERLHKLAAHWRDAALMTIGPIADMIRADDLHVVLDLAGHTSASGIAALGFEPAPVQGTFCGYPGTTGLETLDFRLVDSLTDPAGVPFDAQLHSVEPIERLDPCFLCYRPSDEAPDVSTGPVSRGEPPTFGTFNALKKVSDAAIGAWARVLKEVPGSRFAIKAQALNDEHTQQDLLSRFEALGIDRSRVRIIPSTPTSREHLEKYAGIDIALDTFPYNGTTTTCEALYMGVPVVCFAGDMHASRVGLSLLTGAGLPELCGVDIDDYVRIAVALGNDVPRMKSLRSRLRQTLLASAVCDQAAYAKRFEAALRAIVIRVAGREA